MVFSYNLELLQIYIFFYKFENGFIPVKLDKTFITYEVCAFSINLHS